MSPGNTTTPGSAVFAIRTILSGALLFLIGTVSVASYRGIDLSDESFYLLGFLYPDQTTLFCSFFHLIVGHSIDGFHTGIIGLRFARLALVLISSYVLSVGIFKAFRRTAIGIEFGFLNTVLFISVGSFTSYTLFPQTISYNTLNLSFLQIAVGSLFALYYSNSSKKRSHLWALLFGIAFMLVVLVKPPSGVLFFGLVLLPLSLFVMLKRFEFRVALKYFFAIILGIVGSLFFIFGSVKGLFDGFGKFNRCLSISERHSLEFLSNQFKDDCITLLGWIYHSYVLFFLAVLFAARFLPKLRFTIERATAIGFLVFLSGFVFLNKGYLGGSYDIYEISKAYVILFSFISIGSFLLGMEFRNRIIQHWSVFIFLLFVIPLLGSFGSNSSLSVHLTIYLAFWFPVLLGGALLMSDRLRGKFMLVVFCFGLSLFVCVQTYTGLLNHPYRINEPLMNQTVQLESPDFAKGLLVSPELKGELDTLAILLHKTDFKKGDYLYTTFEQMGLALLSDAIVPGIVPYSSSNMIWNRLNFTSLPLAVQSKSFFLVDTTETTPAKIDSILGSKNNFSDAYDFHGSFNFVDPSSGKNSSLTLISQKQTSKDLPSK